MPQVSSAESQFSTVARKADQAAVPVAIRLVRKAVLVDSRIRVLLASSPVVLDLNIPLVPVLRAQAPAVLVGQAHDLALAHAREALRVVLVLAALEPVQVVHRLRVKRHALRVLPVRQEVVVASNIRRPKKAR